MTLNELALGNEIKNIVESFNIINVWSIDLFYSYYCFFNFVVCSLSSVKQPVIEVTVFKLFRKIFHNQFLCCNVLFDFVSSNLMFMTVFKTSSVVIDVYGK